MRLLLWRSCAAILLLVAGCGPRSGPYAPLREFSRDTTKANRLTRVAAALLETDPEQAETLLRDALAADLYHGRAHHILGVIHLNRGELYEAASEFEWARKLMGGHPDPPVNLALTLERSSDLIDAAKTDSSAPTARPQCLPAMQGLASPRVRADSIDAETLQSLKSIASHSRDESQTSSPERQPALSGP